MHRLSGVTPFPSADPIPLPAPVWLFKVLHNLTFTLHLVSVELLLGGLMLGIAFAALGRVRASQNMVQTGGMIAHRLPSLMAFLINLGVPPLLFAQVLYGRALYTSSVLIGAYWISVIFLLMGSYFGLYYSAKRADARRAWTAPALAALVLALTIAFIYSNNMTLMHGNAVPPGEAARPEGEKRTIPFFPNFLAQDLAMWLIALNVVTILATLFPWDLGTPADALAPAPMGIHPEWYFMSQFQLLKVVGNWIPGFAGEIASMTLFGLVTVFLAIVPVFDPQSTFGKRARLTTWLGVLILTGMIGLTIWGYAAL